MFTRIIDALIAAPAHVYIYLAAWGDRRRERRHDRRRHKEAMRRQLRAGKEAR